MITVVLWNVTEFLFQTGLVSICFFHHNYSFIKDLKTGFLHEIKMTLRLHCNRLKVNVYLEPGDNTSIVCHQDDTLYIKKLLFHQ